MTSGPTDPTIDNTIEPLPSNQPLVGADGTPTIFFQRWAQQRSIDISGGLTFENLMAVLGEILIQAGDGLTGGGPINADVTLGLADSGVTAGAYTSADITVDEYGRVTLAADGSGGAALEVTDGTTSVASVTTILVSGGTVSSPTAGEAEITITGGGGGGATLIQQIVAVGGIGSYTFAAIPQTFDEIELKIIGRSSGSGDNEPVLIQVNGDTGSNYIWGRFGQDAGGTFVEGHKNQGSMTLGYLTAGSSPANSAGTILIRIPYYNRSVWWKAFQGRFQGVGNDSNMYDGFIDGYWQNNPAITDLAVFLGSATFLADCVLELWGYP